MPLWNMDTLEEGVAIQYLQIVVWTESDEPRLHSYRQIVARNFLDQLQTECLVLFKSDFTILGTKLADTVFVAKVFVKI